MKCDICKQEIGTTFLKKIVGTYVYKDSKKKAVCQNCQKVLSKDEIMEKLA